MKLFGIPIDLRVQIYATPFYYDKRFGFEWSAKTSTACPFDYFKKNKWCKTGIRIYYGSRHYHISIHWANDLGWCPNGPDACIISLKPNN